MDRREVYSPRLASKRIVKLLDQLDELKNQFTPDAASRVERLLDRLSRQKFNDTDSLFRYHEILLFLRAYPQNAAIVHATEKELRSFADRVRALEEQDVDLSPLEHPGSFRHCRNFSYRYL